MPTQEEKNQAFGFDTSKKQTFLGAIIVEGEFDHSNEPAWFEFFLMGDNGIDICHFGCNGTCRSGTFQGEEVNEEVNLPAPFANAFLELLEKHKRGEEPPSRPQPKEIPLGWWW